MKRSAPMKRSPMSRVGILAQSSADRLAKAARQVEKAQKPPKARKPMKSRGMKGRAPTAAEQRFMDSVASLGCIACRKDGITNAWISIHHIDGRMKAGAHMKVLPLCAEHHQRDDTDPMGRISVHGDKARFEARYGTQYELLAECVALVDGVTE